LLFSLVPLVCTQFMRLLAALGVLCFLATGSCVMAQVQVSAQTERTDYLLYERLDLIVTLVNTSESDLILDNTEGHPWLSFLVSKENRLPVRQEREANFKPVSLKVGETKTLRVNLTPIFSFREEGNYQAAVVIDLPGEGQILSDSVPFTVVKGRTVWTESRPYNGSTRVYSLIRFSPESDRTKLYLRVEDPEENTVYTNLALGEVVAYIDPDVFFDPQGNLHVMQPISVGTYLYSRTDPDGKVLHQGIFKSTYSPGLQGSIPPRLTKLEDGSVTVAGGTEEDPNQAREMLSDGQKKGGAIHDNKSGLPPAPSPSMAAPTPDTPAANSGPLP
jgi:hypothetical protein